MCAPSLGRSVTIEALPAESSKLRFEPSVLVDYQSPHGAQVTDIRGVVVQGAIAQLREHGHYDAYVRRLPDATRDQIVNALASSWVPVDLYKSHLEALEALALNDAQIAALVAPIGAGLFHNLFSSLIRAARASGGDGSIWFGLRQVDRMFARMHQGGACKVTQVGPKDAIFEVSGLTYGHLRQYRVGHGAFIRGALSHATRTCLCKPQHGPRPDRLAVSISWV